MAPEITEEIEELCQMKHNSSTSFSVFGKFGKVAAEVSFKVEKNLLLGA